MGVWYWGQRLDPQESALQVWHISCVSLRSYILVNSMSVIINVRMTEHLFGPALFLPCGMYSYQVVIAKGVNFGKRLYLENGKCYEYWIWIGLLLKAYRLFVYRAYFLTLLRAGESDFLFFYQNIDVFGH